MTVNSHTDTQLFLPRITGAGIGSGCPAPSQSQARVCTPTEALMPVMLVKGSEAGEPLPAGPKALNALRQPGVRVKVASPEATCWPSNQPRTPPAGAGPVSESNAAIWSLKRRCVPEGEK